MKMKWEFQSITAVDANILLTYSYKTNFHYTLRVKSYSSSPTAIKSIKRVKLNLN